MFKSVVRCAVVKLEECVNIKKLLLESWMSYLLGTGGLIFVSCQCTGPVPDSNLPKRGE